MVLEMKTINAFVFRGALGEPRFKAHIMITGRLKPLTVWRRLQNLIAELHRRFKFLFYGR
jgi:hypothetical protein